VVPHGARALYYCFRRFSLFTCSITVLMGCWLSTVPGVVTKNDEGGTKRPEGGQKDAPKEPGSEFLIFHVLRKVASLQRKVATLA
jgi:hypothetical protein